MARHAITRRGLFRAGALAGGAAVAVGVLGGCSHSSDETTPEPTVVDEDSATSVTDSFELKDSSLQAAATYTLPLGTVPRIGEGSWVAATTVGESASPAVRASALSLSTGALDEVVSGPVSSSLGSWVIFDVRCSDDVYAWVELELSSRSWALYASRFEAGSLTGTTSSLWEATSDWDPAAFCVSGSAVIWQVQPSLTGSKTSEHSYCYVWHAGDANATQAVESPGRFAFPPTAADGVAVLAPRVRASEGTYYGVTAYALSDNLGTVVDQLVMPAGVRPFRAARVDERLAVAVEASYSTGGLLGNMGTYIGSSDGSDFVTVAREPRAEVAGHGDTFVVKVQASYLVVDLADKSYSALSAQDRSLDYGEFPLRSGACDLFATYTTVKDAQTGYPASVCVRTFAL